MYSRFTAMYSSYLNCVEYVIKNLFICSDKLTDVVQIRNKLSATESKYRVFLRNGASQNVEYVGLAREYIISI